jgi:hypothetical protein
MKPFRRRRRSRTGPPLRHHPKALSPAELCAVADLALPLGSWQKTISTIVVGLREHGELLPLRSYLADMGAPPTHTRAVVRLYLPRAHHPDIAAGT